MATPSLKARIAAEALRIASKTLMAKNPSVRTLRLGLEKLMKWLPTPTEVEIENECINGVNGRWVKPKILPQECPLILYLHGGAYAMGSSRSHSPMAARIIKRIDADIFLPDYRLAPENPFPAALDDCEQVYSALIQQFPNRTIFLAGDSAGGGLCIALLTRIRDKELPKPQATLLFSPWCDLSAELPDAVKFEKKDPYLTIPLIRRFGKYYAGENSSNPEASPLNAELHDLGKILLQAGGNEILRADAEELHKRSLNYTGTEIKLEIYKGMFHVFQAGDGLFPEAANALDKACEWLKSQSSE